MESIMNHSLRQRLPSPIQFCRRLLFLCSLLLCCLMLAACQTLPYGSRSKERVQALAIQNDFALKLYQTADFDLLGAVHDGDPKRLHIYIEGDGLAWRSRWSISRDPTPTEPVSMELAALDKTGATIIYLARPGHYIQDGKTSFLEWTHKRYSKEVLQTYESVLSQIMATYPQARVTLLGYSGGGALALLMAAQKVDVLRGLRVVTFAGLLDHKQWTDIHDITPLRDNLNPPDYAQILSTVPQIHFVGEKDTMVPQSIAQGYLNQLSRAIPEKSLAQVIHLKGVNHWSGWEAFWKKDHNQYLS